MNPNYVIFLDICLTKPQASGNIWVRLVKSLSFVPRKGDVLRLSSEDENICDLDIELENVVYNTSEGIFVEEQEDSYMVENYREEGLLDEAGALAKYSPYGFIRLNFPQGVAR